MSDGAAHATITLAMSTAILTGGRGRGNANLKRFALPLPQKTAST